MTFLVAVLSVLGIAFLVVGFFGIVSMLIDMLDDGDTISGKNAERVALSAHQKYLETMDPKFQVSRDRAVIKAAAGLSHKCFTYLEDRLHRMTIVSRRDKRYN